MSDAKFQEARNIISLALSSSHGWGGHEFGCPLEVFIGKNKHLPVNHPAYQYAPLCNCWRGRAERFLKSTI